MMHMRSTVNGDFEMLLDCASIADYAEAHDYHIENLMIVKFDNYWQIDCDLIPFVLGRHEIDDIPF